MTKANFISIAALIIVSLFGHNAMGSFDDEKWSAHIKMDNQTHFSIQYLRSENDNHGGHFNVDPEFYKRDHTLKPGETIKLGFDEHTKNPVNGRLYFKSVDLDNYGFLIRYHFHKVDKPHDFHIEQIPGQKVPVVIQVEKKIIDQKKKKKSFGLKKYSRVTYEFIITVKPAPNFEAILAEASNPAPQNLLTDEESDQDTDDETREQVAEFKKKLKKEKANKLAKEKEALEQELKAVENQKTSILARLIKLK